ncbi:Unknown protein, partial [Striga hermonthica]
LPWFGLLDFAVVSNCCTVCSLVLRRAAGRVGVISAVGTSSTGWSSSERSLTRSGASGVRSGTEYVQQNIVENTRIKAKNTDIRIVKWLMSHLHGLSTRVRTPSSTNFLEPHHQELPQATVVALFRDYHPEKFSGQGDPRVVDEWVQGLEIIFEVMNCPDRYRMLCAQIQLTVDARLWWQAYWSMRPGEKDGCTWDQFKELIREKYYPSYYRADMERQFLALTQGTRTVDEYEREFTRLGAF